MEKIHALFAGIIALFLSLTGGTSTIQPSSANLAVAENTATGTGTSTETFEKKSLEVASTTPTKSSINLIKTITVNSLVDDGEGGYSEVKLFPSGEISHIQRNTKNNKDVLFLDNKEIATAEDIMPQEINIIKNGGDLLYAKYDNSSKEYTLFEGDKKTPYTYSISIDGKFCYIQTNTKSDTQTLICDDKKIITPPKNMFKNDFSVINGKLGYTVSDSDNKKTIFIYDGKEVATADGFYGIKFKNFNDKIAYITTSSSGPDVLFYDQHQIKTAEGISFLNDFTTEKLSYITFNRKPSEYSYFYDNKKLSTSTVMENEMTNSVPFVKEINGKVAYIKYNDKYSQTLFYDNKEIVTANKIRDYGEIGNKFFYVTYNEKINDGVLFYDNEKIATSDGLVASNGFYRTGPVVKKIGNKIAYVTYDATSKKYSLFYDNKKIADLDSYKNFSEVLGKLTFQSYDKVSKKYSLFYDDKIAVIDDYISDFVDSEKSSFFYTANRKNKQTFFSVYEIK